MSITFTLRNITLNNRDNKIITHPVLSIAPVNKDNNDVCHKFKVHIIPNDKFIDNNGISYNEITHLHCWWCKNLFENLPIGIPLFVYNKDNTYVNHQIGQLYKYVVNNTNNNTTKEQCKVCIDCKQEFKTTIDNIKCTNCNENALLFIMEGVMCSFECCKSYINEYKHVDLYANSEKLLYFLYYRCFGISEKIKFAPDWRSLSTYSGDISMDIIKFRKDSTLMIKTSNIYLTPCGVYTQIVTS